LIATACTRPDPTAEAARRERWTYDELGREVGVCLAGARDPVPSGDQSAPDRLLDDDRLLAVGIRGAGEICGLYVDPLENVLVGSIDEKTGIHAKSPTKPE
jgi:hypothetical protein